MATFGSKNNSQNKILGWLARRVMHDCEWDHPDLHARTRKGDRKSFA